MLIQIDVTQNYLVGIDQAGAEMVTPAEQNDIVLAEFAGFGGTDPVPAINAILLDGAPFLPPAPG